MSGLALYLPRRSRFIPEITDYHTVSGVDGRPVLRARFTDDKWADLPTIQCHPTLSDEDREFESDLAYMRDLVTELHVHGSVEHLAGILDAPMAEWDIDLYLEPVCGWCLPKHPILEKKP